MSDLMEDLIRDQVEIVEILCNYARYAAKELGTGISVQATYNKAKGDIAADATMHITDSESIVFEVTGDSVIRRKVKRAVKPDE